MKIHRNEQGSETIQIQKIKHVILNCFSSTVANSRRGSGEAGSLKTLTTLLGFWGPGRPLPIRGEHSSFSQHSSTWIKCPEQLRGGKV